MGHMDPISELPRVPASDVKKGGWRGLMRTVRSAGPVAITNHSEPEAVVLSAQEYERLVARINETESKTVASLEALRHRFDERLAVFGQPGAADRLRAIAKSPVSLKGKVKAGTGY